MNIRKRLSNLWALSEYELPPIGISPSDYPVGTKVAQSLVSPPQATIIPYKPRDPVKDIVGDESAVINQ